MGEVTYYEHDWERDLARMHIGPSPQPSRITNTSVMPNYVPIPGHKNIEDLPVELLCKIFEYSVADFTPISTKGLSTPETLSRVSKKWRSVVTSFVWLWNYIVIDCGDWTNMPYLIQSAHKHLQRCGDLPITIQTTGSASPTSAAPQDQLAIHNLLSPYTSRIRHLTLAFPVEWMNNFLGHAANPTDVESLESVKLVYHPHHQCPPLGDNNMFTHAYSLHTVEIEYASELGWKYLESNTVNLPWSQITELNLIHVVASPPYLQAILANCTALENLTLSIIKAADDNTNHFPFGMMVPGAHVHHNHVSFPSLKHLTLYNPKNFDYSKYLASLRIHFPSLEHFGTSSSGDPRNGRQWSHSQFVAILAENVVPLLSVSTPAHISHADIENIIGDVPSLRVLDVRAGDPISETTIRLMTQGYLAQQMEELTCAVAPMLLSSFLDMVEGRYVSRRSKAIYRGFKKLVIRCPKNSQGYVDVHERIEELRQWGRDITVVES